MSSRLCACSYLGIKSIEMWFPKTFLPSCFSFENVNIFLPGARCHNLQFLTLLKMFILSYQENYRWVPILPVT